MRDGRPEPRTVRGALVRWGVPAALTGIGLGVAFTVNKGVGEALVGAAVCVVVATQLLRFGFSSDTDRDREEAAREYFDEHGRWPDEG